MQNRKEIAVIIPGGIGTGPGNIGVPVLERLVKQLSVDYSITVFSLFEVNESYLAGNFRLVSISSRNFIIKSFALFFSFWKFHRRYKFEVIHGFWTLPSGFLTVLLSKFFKLRSIISVLGGDAVALPEIQYGELRKFLPRKMILWSLENADDVIVLTDYLKANLERYGLKRNVSIIPWGIDTNQFSFQDKKLHAGKVQFLHVANLNDVKDQETLLRAFNLIRYKKDAHLTIIGRGIRELETKKLAAQLDLESKITWIEFVPYDELPKYYHQSDILLHTSLSEGQCEVVTEAMSSGLVVCGTSVGLLYDLPDCCISVPVKDYKMFANKVVDILEDDRKRLSIRMNAHDWSVQHSMQWTVEQISRIYSEDKTQLIIFIPLK